MDVGRKGVGIIKSPYADEADLVAGAAVIAPQSDAARGAPADQLAFAAVRRCVDGLRCAREQQHAVRLDHRVECERRAGLSLAPSAMAAMDEQRLARHVVADGTTGAATLEGLTHNNLSLFLSALCARGKLFFDQID